MKFETIQGYLYAVTAGDAAVQVTDSNGLALTVEAGKQSVIVATTNELVVDGSATLTQLRSE